MKPYIQKNTQMRRIYARQKIGFVTSKYMVKVGTLQKLFKNPLPLEGTAPSSLSSRRSRQSGTHQVVESFLQISFDLTPLPQMAVSLWGLLLAAPGRGLHLQGAAEV